MNFLVVIVIEIVVTGKLKMNNTLHYTKCISFLTILSLPAPLIQDLQRINPQWVTWLKQHYISKTKIRLEEIPFYVPNQVFAAIYKKILAREDLAGIFSTNLFYMEVLDRVYFEKPYLYIPADASEIYIHHTSFKKHRAGYLPRSILNKLKVLPKGIYALFARYDGSMRLLAYLTEQEFQNRKDMKGFDARDIEVGKFCRQVGLEKMECYIKGAGEKCSGGFVVEIGAGIFDMRYVK